MLTILKWLGLAFVVYVVVTKLRTWLSPLPTPAVFAATTAPAGPTPPPVKPWVIEPNAPSVTTRAPEFGRALILLACGGASASMLFPWVNFLGYSISGIGIGALAALTAWHYPFVAALKRWRMMRSLSLGCAVVALLIALVARGKTTNAVLWFDVGGVGITLYLLSAVALLVGVFNYASAHPYLHVRMSRVRIELTRNDKLAIDLICPAVDQGAMLASLMRAATLDPRGTLHRLAEEKDVAEALAASSRSTGWRGWMQRKGMADWWPSAWKVSLTLKVPHADKQAFERIFATHDATVLAASLMQSTILALSRPQGQP